MPCFHLELGQDGVAKGFGGNSSAVGDEKYGSMGHSWNSKLEGGALRPKITAIIFRPLALQNQFQQQARF
jgi:hypothetical protein